MRTVLALLLAALTLAGCGGEGDDTSTSPTVHANTRDSANLSFQGTTLAGETFEGESLAGQPAVLWFWAPWCPTCMSQIPNLNHLAEQYQGQVEIVGVGGLDSRKAIRSKAGGMEDVTHLIDDEGTIWKHFGVVEQSTYTVIDADGEIVSQGFLEDDALNNLVADLVESG